jgi:hypothetical protein
MTEMLNSCIPKLITDYIVFYHIENCGIMIMGYYDPCFLEIKEETVTEWDEFCADCAKAAGLTIDHFYQVEAFMFPRFKVPKNLCTICAVPLAIFRRRFCCNCKFYYKFIMSRRQRDNLKK